MKTISRLAVFVWLLAMCFNFGHARPPQPQGADTPPTYTGFYRGKAVTYILKNGRALTQGDILLPKVESMPPTASTSDAIVGQSVTIGYPSSKWRKVGGVYQIPYVTTSTAANLLSALSTFNTTFAGVIQFVPRAAEVDYVDITVNLSDFSGQGFSALGRSGGRQELYCAGNCTVGTFLHEMGHAVGLYHTHVRADRDSFVTLHLNNVIKTLKANYDIPVDNVAQSGSYDFASIMHYGAYTFTRNGEPTMESIPPGMRLSTSSGYSAGDVDGIKRLYDMVPTSVTITSNPTGLVVIVDGANVTTPSTFAWPLNSNHTIAVQAGSQTLAGKVFGFGRWSNDGAQSQTIAVTPGNGAPGISSTSPAITVYSANFVELVPFTQAVSPSGTGSMSITPPPQPVPPAAGQFLPIRQAVVLQATPNGGQNFYGWFGVGGAFSRNPRPLRVPEDYVPPIALTAAFTTSPLATIATNPPDLWLKVDTPDGFCCYAPRSFGAPNDPTWTTGSVHSLDVFNPVAPYSANTRYAFVTWSDAGAQSHTITKPAANTTYTANFVRQYAVAAYVNPSCGGRINQLPLPTAGFYNAGTDVTFSQTPSPGWTFAGWSEDITAATSPQSIPVNDEVLVVANYNTIATPLTIAGFTPATIAAGSASFLLSINGTGFTNSSSVFVNGAFRASTFVSATQLRVTVNPGDVANPGQIPVGVSNFPAGAACAAFQQRGFNISPSISQPNVGLTPTSLIFTAQARTTTSAARVITLTNTGNASLNVASLITSGDFVRSTTCLATLAAGANCRINVSFVPSAIGNRTGAITLTTNAPGSPHTVNLSGAGVALAVSVNALAFGNQVINVASATRSLTLTNKSAAPVSLTSISITGTNANQFALGSTTCGATLAPSTTCNVGVRFTPTSVGAKSASLSIASSDFVSPRLISLSGTGTWVQLSSATLDFGITVLNSTAPTRSVTLTNTAVTPLVMASVTLTGTAASNYAIVNNTCIGSIPAGGNCVTTLQFTPSAIGSRSATLSFNNNGGGSPQRVSLIGVGTTVQFSSSNLAFGNQALNTTSAARTVTLTNVGATAITVNAVALSGTNASNFAVASNTCGSMLNASASCAIGITFRPITIGAKSATLNITHTGGGSPRQVSLNGNGI